MTDGGRRYTDQEFALILRSAAESGGATRDRSVPSGEGLTLAEMIQIAGEVGIDATSVERAARRLAEKDSESSSRFLGGATRMTRSVGVAKALEPHAVASVIDVIRDAAGQSGEVSEELGRVVWRNVGEPTLLRVSLAPGEDTTEVVVSADRNGAFVLTWAFPVMGGMVGAGIVGAIIEPTTVVGGISLFVGMATGGLLVARTLWARGTRHMERKLEAVLERTRRAIADLAGQPGGGAADPER